MATQHQTAGNYRQWGSVGVGHQRSPVLTGPTVGGSGIGTGTSSAHSISGAAASAAAAAAAAVAAAVGGGVVEGGGGAGGIGVGGGTDSAANNPQPTSAIVTGGSGGAPSAHSNIYYQQRHLTTSGPTTASTSTNISSTSSTVYTSEAAAPSIAITKPTSSDSNKTTVHGNQRRALTLSDTSAPNAPSVRSSTTAASSSSDSASNTGKSTTTTLLGGDGSDNTTNPAASNINNVRGAPLNAGISEFTPASSSTAPENASNMSAGSSASTTSSSRVVEPSFSTSGPNVTNFNNPPNNNYYYSVSQRTIAATSYGGGGRGGGGGGGRPYNNNNGAPPRQQRYHYPNNSRPNSEPESLSSTNVYIRGLTPSTTDRDLRNMCEQYGAIVSIKAVQDDTLSQCKGYGFVNFVFPDDAARAVQGLNERKIPAQMAKASIFLQQHNSSFIQQELDPTNLYFTNLPLNMGDSELKRFLQKYTPVVDSTRIMRDSITNLSKGTGFARLGSHEECELIIRLMNGKPFDGVPNGNLLGVKFADFGADKKNNGSAHQNQNRQLPQHSSHTSQNLRTHHNQNHHNRVWRYDNHSSMPNGFTMVATSGFMMSGGGGAVGNVGVGVGGIGGGMIAGPSDATLIQTHHHGGPPPLQHPMMLNFGAPAPAMVPLTIGNGGMNGGAPLMTTSPVAMSNGGTGIVSAGASSVGSNGSGNENGNGNLMSLSVANGPNGNMLGPVMCNGLVGANGTLADAAAIAAATMMNPPPSANGGGNGNGMCNMTSSYDPNVGLHGQNGMSSTPQPHIMPNATIQNFRPPYGQVSDVVYAYPSGPTQWLPPPPPQFVVQNMQQVEEAYAHLATYSNEGQAHRGIQGMMPPPPEAVQYANMLPRLNAQMQALQMGAAAATAAGPYMQTPYATYYHHAPPMMHPMPADPEHPSNAASPEDPYQGYQSFGPR